MRVITRHLAKETLVATAFVLFALAALFAFFDLVGQLGSIGSRYSIWAALKMTVFEVPRRLYEVMPIAALLGGVYTLSRWASDSEFTILRVSGLSPVRLATMLLVPGLLMMSATYMLGEYITPQADRIWKETKAVALNRTLKARGYNSGVWVKDTVYDKDGRRQLQRFVNVRNLIAGRDDRTGPWRVFEFGPDGRLARLVHASGAEHLRDKGWRLAEARVETLPTIDRSEAALEAKAETIRPKDLVVHSDMNPELLGVLTIKPESMSIAELWRYIGHLQENRQKTRSYEVAFWSKVFYPIAILVMLAVAMPFAYLNARSGGMSAKIFIGLMIGISFYALNHVFEFVGTLSTLPACVVALVPSCVMLIGAVGVMWQVEKR